MKPIAEITCAVCGKKKMVTIKRARTCSNKCSSALWRLEHPKKASKNRSYSTRKICGRDDIRRDRPQDWIKYMRLNPIYLECLINSTWGSKSMEGIL
jgi:hypothetical protein